MIINCTANVQSRVQQLRITVLDVHFQWKTHLLNLQRSKHCKLFELAAKIDLKPKVTLSDQI